MSGGFDLTVREGREFSLLKFKKNYKKFFSSLPEKFNYENKISIYISLTGFRDKITKEIETQDPFRRKD